MHVPKLPWLVFLHSSNILNPSPSHSAKAALIYASDLPACFALSISAFVNSEASS
jgi:hypothetical protein